MLDCVRKSPTVLSEINGEHEHLLEQDFTGEQFCLISNSGTDKVVFEERLSKTLEFAQLTTRAKVIKGPNISLYTCLDQGTQIEESKARRPK